LKSLDNSKTGSSSIFNLANKKGSSRLMISERPYFYKDWTYLKTQSDSNNNIKTNRSTLLSPANGCPLGSIIDAPRPPLEEVNHQIA